MQAAATSDQAIPTTSNRDIEDVSWALSTAATLWRRQDCSEALKWLRRAASAASEDEDDLRAVELFKAAAEVADLLDRPSAVTAAPAPEAESQPPSEQPVPSQPASSPPPPPTRVRYSAAGYDASRQQPAARPKRRRLGSMHAAISSKRFSEIRRSSPTGERHRHPAPRSAASPPPPPCRADLAATAAEPYDDLEEETAVLNDPTARDTELTIIDCVEPEAAEVVPEADRTVRERAHTEVDPEVDDGPTMVMSHTPAFESTGTTCSSMQVVVLPPSSPGEQPQVATFVPGEPLPSGAAVALLIPLQEHDGEALSELIPQCYL